MKIVIGLSALAGIALLSLFLWSTGDPGTELLDSSGAPLVAAGSPLDPSTGDVESLFASARQKLSQARFAEAKQELLEILEAEQHDGTACVLLSHATRELRQVEEAVDYGLKAVQLLPEQASAHLAYARALGVQLMTGFDGVGGMLKALPRIKRFKKELELVVQYDPQDTEARTMQVFAAMAPVVGDADQALRVAREIEAIDGLLGKKMLAYALSYKGDLEEAIEVCRAGMQEHPLENGLPLILAGLYRDRERLEEARAAFARVRELGPRNEDYHLSMIKQADMQIAAGVHGEESLQLMQEFIAARPVGDWIPSQAEAQYLLGAALQGLGRKDKAREAFQESLRLQPGHKRATKALAAGE